MPSTKRTFEATKQPGERTQPAKRSKYDYFDGIVVLVGKDEATKFIVHESIVRESSQFFNAALREEWKEGEEKKVHLQESTPHSFGVYVGWLYNGTIDLSTKDEPTPAYVKGMSDPVFNGIAQKLLDCWVLGDMLENRRFCNTIIDEFLAFVNGTMMVPTNAMPGWWPQLSPTSTMARLLVDFVAADISIVNALKRLPAMPAELVLEVSKTCIKEREQTVTSRQTHNRPRCYYHEHKDESDKCAEE